MEENESMEWQNGSMKLSGHTCIPGMEKVDSVVTLPPTYRVCQPLNSEFFLKNGMKMELTKILITN
jgi:hypothetical protein